MQAFLDRLVANVTSIKFFVILVSCYFFNKGTLNQEGWIFVILTTTGIRAFNEGVSMYVQMKTGQVPPPAAPPPPETL